MTRPWDGLHRRDYTITLTVAGPVLSQGSGMRESYLDAVFARDSNDRPILPGTHVAGHLSEAWETLREAATGTFDPRASAWLGRASESAGSERKTGRVGATDDADSNEPQRKRLVFGDFKLVGEAPEEGRRRLRIAVGETGAAKPHALQFFENLAPDREGATVAFEGQAYAIGGARELDELEGNLRVGLRFVERLGANKGVGFGAVENVEVVPLCERSPDRTPVPPLPTDASDLRFGLVIRPDSPMLFARPLTAGNTFESTDEIPGGAIKGAIAELRTVAADAADWERSPLFHHLDCIRFGHAFPGAADAPRPVRFPLSLVRYSKGELSGEPFDTALIEEPPLSMDGAEQWAAEYAPDWKESVRREIMGRFGWRFPKRELRVRTAIDPRLRRAAEAELFAHETVLPRDEDGAAIAWYGYVDFSEVPKDAQQRALADLHDLLQRFGLARLGKTKACAAAQLCSRLLPAVTESLQPLPYDGEAGGPLWVLTLQTDAVLVECEALRPDATADTLHRDYDEIWREISDRKLRLIDYFAQQKLAGGGYLHRRFLKKGAGVTEYQPVPLTEAGSVFVLAPVAGPGAAVKDAQELIDKFWRRGLPLPDWAKRRFRDGGDAPQDPASESEAPLWRRLPYLRQNGYGEVAVNLATHTESCPEPFRLVGGRRQAKAETGA